MHLLAKTIEKAVYYDLSVLRANVKECGDSMASSY